MYNITFNHNCNSKTRNMRFMANEIGIVLKSPIEGDAT